MPPTTTGTARPFEATSAEARSPLPRQNTRKARSAAVPGSLFAAKRCLASAREGLWENRVQERAPEPDVLIALPKTAENPGASPVTITW